MADQGDQEVKLQEFCSVTGARPEQGTQYLEAHNWDTLGACQSFFNDQEEEQAYTGPRTLDGRPAPQEPASSSRGARPAAQNKKKGIATLGSLGGSSHQHDDHGDSDDDDFEEDEDERNRGNLFAGGEKSGLAVQDPSQEGGSKKIISDILAKARANASRPDAPSSDAGPSRGTHFRGTGMTLGGEGEESRSIPDPSGPPRPTNAEPQERVLHIWQDGFSIDDGELRRFDDPNNQVDLQMIRSGRAPLHLMNVQSDQPVDVKLHQHDTPYTPQPKKYKPFSGSGHRLGSPVPGDGNEAAGSSSLNAAVTTSTTTPAAGPPTPTIDSSQPTITIRVQLPNGSRLPARFNTTNTVGDVYSFVQAASAELQSRSWVIATTFPNKDHTDQSLVLGEMPEFKKGGTAVVKWT